MFGKLDLETLEAIGKSNSSLQKSCRSAYFLGIRVLVEGDELLAERKHFNMMLAIAGLGRIVRRQYESGAADLGERLIRAVNAQHLGRSADSSRRLAEHALGQRFDLADEFRIAHVDVECDHFPAKNPRAGARVR